ncbi:MAG: primosomal protein N' [Deltaproteobacteria bacterium]|nr:primosomal protein N' [Deltaproteobacteria bacterium]
MESRLVAFPGLSLNSSWMNETAANFARVVVPSPLLQALTYAVPQALRDSIAVGSRVLIPLGKRKLSGVVIELLPDPPLLQTKDILAVLDDRPVLDDGLIRLLHWISHYYLASVGEVLTAILPPSLRLETEQWLRLKVEEFAVADPVEEQIIHLLRQRNGRATVKFLARQVEKTSILPAVARLEAAGVVSRRERVPGLRRRKVHSKEDLSGGQASQPFDLSDEQENAYRAIATRIEQGGFATFLLHGVTGSGKTEVYLRAMENCRNLGRRSLILIPEISLTPQLIDRVTARFPGRVGVLHSALTGAQRWAHWWSILRGEVDVVVGARSAVFAPLPDLGLIIVDEEHDPSYKQEEGLRYNGRDLAVVRGKLVGCPVLLGSATPAIESYENCRQGRYRLLEISRRVNERPLPKIEIVDLREQPLRAKDQASAPSEGGAASEPAAALALISPPLAEALVENFNNRRQSLIFMNRRGFSNFLQCRLCGHVLRCSYCSVTLTLHLKQRSVRCHHCDFRKPVTQLCPGCGNESLTGIGAGTEQIEQALKHLLPLARVARMDRDTTSKRGSQEALIRSWEKGELDVLVGTQMITKGHDVMGVTLVGALLADLSLNLPDFRAAERTFQLLSQVAGRSGRGNDPGRVIVQTYAPDHYAMQDLLNHDYKGFFAAEVEFRRALSYPPFSRLVQLRLDGPRAEEVEGEIKKLATALRRRLSTQEKFSSQLELLGPAPAPIEKLRNRYRWQLLIKGKQIGPLLEFAQLAREGVRRGRAVRLHIDVDPYSML